MPSFIGWVPTPTECVDGFFDLTPLSASDVVYDLGCGDGRLLFAALEKGAGRVVGIDLNAELVCQSREEAKNKGFEGRATFLEADVMEVDLSPATLVLCYLFPTASEALRPKFESELKPGTRVIMETFDVPGWKAVKTVEKGTKKLFLYILPAEATAQPHSRVRWDI
jgi:SAM-dependent methyltransferase